MGSRMHGLGCIRTTWAPRVRMQVVGMVCEQAQGGHTEATACTKVSRCAKRAQPHVGSMSEKSIPEAPEGEHAC